jgi:polar amino acid transport system substrate-binding protein
MPNLRFHLLGWAFSVLVIVSAQAGASTIERILERGHLILGTSGNMPAMSMIPEPGRLVGYDIDLGRLIAESMGVGLQPRVMPFDQLLAALQDGEVDIVISNMTITPERNLRVAFVGPYLVSGKCIVTKDVSLAKADEASTDLNTAETRLAVLKGSTSQDFVREILPKATVVPVDDYDQAAEMVRDDEVTGLLSDYPICLATLKAHPDAEFVSLFSLLTYEPIGIALPGGDAQFVNWAENFLDRLKGTHTLKALNERWFGRPTLIEKRP